MKKVEYIAVKDAGKDTRAKYHYRWRKMRSLIYAFYEDNIENLGDSDDKIPNGIEII